MDWIEETTGQDYGEANPGPTVVPLQSKDHFASLTCSKAKTH